MVRYAEVALNLSWESETLVYEIPDNLKNLKAGMRVLVELNGVRKEGVVTEIHSNEPNYKTKPILKQIDFEEVVTKEQLDLAYWMKDKYLSSLGESLFLMVPKGRKIQKKKYEDTHIAIDKLHKLNPEQSLALSSIQKSEQHTHLLFGITGSGKTEVYIHLMYEVLSQESGTVIYLVPEISLTFPTIQRIEAIFPGQVAVLHSYLKTQERFQNYLDLLNGKKRICIGTRSAVFAPVRDLKLVIIDEEHDSSYKEHSSPRYHARQIAVKRIMDNKGKLVLGSATPSVEIFHLAKQGKVGLQKLSKRANIHSKLPEIIVKENESQLISGDLQFKIADRLKKKEQIIILLNRRGYNPFIYNKNTKEFVQCPNCSTTLCYHKESIVRCHLCGYRTNLQKIKNEIGQEIDLLGVGTQKLEETLLESFPQARIERLDQDSTKNKEITKQALEKLESGEIDILTGTQMISKGLDFANVTLVGIINANHGLGIPDFRSTERTYALLSQVSGRAGRAEKRGEVVLQSSDPSHPVIQMAMEQNYESYFDWEINFRKELGYPPFQRLVRLVFRSKMDDKAAKQAVAYSDLIRSHSKYDPKTISLLGPAPCSFFKIDSNFRYHILLKSNDISLVRDLLSNIKDFFKKDNNCYVEYDFDPLDLV